MSESKQDASLRRRRFDEEFKQAAVRLIVEEKYTFKAAAAAVGVSDQTLRSWHARFAAPPAACGEHATVEELRAENQRLRKQLRRAELEREILKKATAYFAKESL
jgi:transposase